MQTAQNMSCPAALERHAKLAHEQGYAAEPGRQGYEAFIAGCLLEAGQAQQALALARKLDEPAERRRALALTARASAALGDVAGAQAALDALPSVGPVFPELFLQSVEFRKYATEEWFIAAALEAWSPEGRLSLEEYVSRIVMRGNAELVPLRVAAADVARKPGDWAVWIGNVRNGQLDRAQNQTLLRAEGLDVRRNLVAVDRKVTKVTSKWSGFSSSSGSWSASGSSGTFRGNAANWGTGVSTPEYQTDEIYEEVFTPNGVEFLVEFPGINEQVVQAGTIAVVGRYAGHNAAGVPRLRAVLVAARPEQETRERLEEGR